jgi:hypothetical protein
MAKERPAQVILDALTIKDSIIALNNDTIETLQAMVTLQKSMLESKERIITCDDELLSLKQDIIDSLESTIKLRLYEGLLYGATCVSVIYGIIYFIFR